MAGMQGASLAVNPAEIWWFRTSLAQLCSTDQFNCVFDSIVTGQTTVLPIFKPLSPDGLIANLSMFQERNSQGVRWPLMLESRPALQGVPNLMSIQESMSLPLSLPPPYLYTCTIGRKRSQARFDRPHSLHPASSHAAAPHHLLAIRVVHLRVHARPHTCAKTGTSVYFLKSDLVIPGTICLGLCPANSSHFVHCESRQRGPSSSNLGCPQ